MTLFLISFIAGVLTVLAPCILPLLPVIVGSSVGSNRKATPYVVIGALALSILLFTYLLKASTVLLGVPQYFWSYFSGGVLVAFGLILFFPQIWERLSFIAKTSSNANQLLGAGHQKQSYWGDALVGVALGPVFSSCSPTYFVILATVLPASFFLGTLYLLAYIAGLVLVLGLIAALGQRVTAKLQLGASGQSWLKRGVGILFIIVGIFILTGNDKKLEAWVLDQGFLDGVIELEQELLEETEMNDATDTATPEKLNTSARENSASTNGNDATERDANDTEADAAIDVPRALARSFPETDFSKADPNLENAISGGPPKDGIPSIDDPKFVPLSSFSRPNSVRAIVIEGENITTVYPYNILVWHEIVNDEIDGVPVAVTFCPLCGSAIVYDRTLPDGQVSTFGVSGFLLESNMIMYDRATENLWQQSTGKTLAGSFHPSQLDILPFQLLTLGDVREEHPNAVVLSEDTGYRRNYGRNPYAGYEENDRFAFDPSEIDRTFDPKEVMVVFRDERAVFAAPWQQLLESGGAEHEQNDTTYFLSVSENNELSITDDNGDEHPFFFEMWFSVAVQNEDLVVIEP